MNRLLPLALVAVAGVANAQDPFDPTGGDRSESRQGPQQQSAQARLTTNMVMQRIGELEARLSEFDMQSAQDITGAAGKAGGVAKQLVDSLPVAARGAAKLVGKINDGYWVDLNGVHLEVTESAFKQIQKSQLGSFGSGEE